MEEFLQMELQFAAQASNQTIPMAEDNIVCSVCKIDRDDDKVLLCDTCDLGFHIYCLTPPLKRIPKVCLIYLFSNNFVKHRMTHSKGEWYCSTCKAIEASKTPGTLI
jgi:hypothetical protein